MRQSKHSGRLWIRQAAQVPIGVAHSMHGAFEMNLQELDMPPRSLDVSQPRKYTFGGALNGVATPQTTLASQPKRAWLVVTSSPVTRRLISEPRPLFSASLSTVVAVSMSLMS